MAIPSEIGKILEKKPDVRRSGGTVVTSVSVSKDFQKLINQYNISPTECFRRGVAVTLCDLGVGMYQSPKNEGRSKYMHEFLEKLENDEKLKKEFEKIQLFEDIQKQLNNISLIIKKINRIEIDDEKKEVEVRE